MIAIDVDGVLADFLGGIANFYNTRIKEQTTWSELPIPKGVSDEVFWKFGPSDPNFYAGVKPLPWAFELVSTIENMGHDFFLATSCSEGSVPHKANWIRRYFGDVPAAFFTVGVSKMDHHFDLLIDDNPILEGHPNVLTFPAKYNEAFLKEVEIDPHDSLSLISEEEELSLRVGKFFDKLEEYIKEEQE